MRADRRDLVVRAFAVSIAALASAVAASEAALAQSTGQPSAPFMEFVPVRPGTFTMGCSPGDPLCDGDESPAHRVRLTKAYEIVKYEVTQAQWMAIVGANPSNFKGDDRRPVERVTWDAVHEFLQRLTARNDGYRYRLPTEAEWECAARAGTTGPNTGQLDEVAWHQANAGKQTHPVGTKRANAWGLHDAEGNVYEWTQDFYDDYTNDEAVDPRGPDTGGDRIPRGGSWNSTPKGVRTSNRNLNAPDNPDFNIGFRVVREPTK
jgi:formylglycine-generating enzyme required for sulfatase activity